MVGAHHRDAIAYLPRVHQDDLGGECTHGGVQRVQVAELILAGEEQRGARGKER